MKTFKNIHLIIILNCTILLGCKKEKEQLPENYGELRWFCSISIDNPADTVATPQSTGQDYRIVFTRNLTSDRPFALHYYWNNNLLERHTVQEYYFSDSFDSYDYSEYTVEDDETIEIFSYQNGSYHSTYGFPFININGVGVRNIFKGRK